MSGADADADGRARPEREPAAGPPATPRPGREGLCPHCAHCHAITNDRGSTFLLCRLWKEDPRFPRYPAQPVVACPGFRQ